MFGSLQEGDSSMEIPEIIEMARDLGPVPQADALKYARSLKEEDTRVKDGCYTVRCVKGCKCPVACVYAMECEGCLFQGCSTIPFGCCYIANYHITQKGPVYMNAKGDTIMVKIDQERETIACYTQGCGGPCCYYTKM